MDAVAPWFFLLTSILASCLAVACAVVSWRAASECSSATKHLREMRADLADLQSSYDSLLASHRKLASRVGMRSKRERDAAVDDLDDIKPGDKAALRRKYLNGKSPQQIASEALVGSITPGGDA